MSTRFITLEGVDGCGKSTQAMLLARVLELSGYTVLRLREPGGVKISEQIRKVLLDPQNDEMGDMCELLLYEAARAQLVHEVIAPALNKGTIVVCDRFYDSTTAYQSFADGLDRKVVDQANSIAVDGCRPDVTFVFDIDAREALSRRSGRGGEDRLELKGLQFQEKVAAGFRALIKEEPERVKRIDATASIESVFNQVIEQINATDLHITEDAKAQALSQIKGA